MQTRLNSRLLLALMMVMAPAASAMAADGVLRLTSEPSGIQIRIDGVLKGFTPQTLDLPAGEHTIDFDMIGCHRYTRSVTLKADDVSIVNARLGRRAITLSALNTTGRILITSDSPGARITFNNVLQRSASSLVKDLPRGLSWLRIGAFEELIPIVDGSVVKAHFDGTRITVTYGEKTRPLLENQTPGQSELVFLPLDRGLARAQEKSKSLLLVSTENTHAEVEELLAQDPVIRSHVLRNAILVHVDPTSNREITLNGITTPEALIHRNTFYQKDQVRLVTSAFSGTHAIDLNSTASTLRSSLFHLNVVFAAEKVPARRERDFAGHDGVSTPSFYSGDLSDMLGSRPLALLFVGSPRMREIIGKLVKVEREYDLNDTMIVVVFKSGTRETWVNDFFSRLADSEKFSWPVSINPKAVLSKKYEMQSVPALLCIDRNGDVLGVEADHHRLRDEEVIKQAMYHLLQ